MKTPEDTPFKTRYYRQAPNGKIVCTLCPRECSLSEGQRGLCFVRGREEDSIVLYTYGKTSGLCVDPIEKKPLYHFLPSSSVLSFGTAGCNLTCKFCQNWHMSKSRDIATSSIHYSPSEIAQIAKRQKCASVAFTYNDPVIFMEYAVDTAQACREEGIASVAVTAGYINKEPREEFFRYIDGANIDLKGFTESFYKKLCTGKLGAVLDTLRYVAKETNVWLEVTTLLIPEENDSPNEIERLSSWIANELGRNVPLHFTAFHPDFRLTNRPRTPLETLVRAREIALSNGLNFVYIGNVLHEDGSTTYCRRCHLPLIKRWGYSTEITGLNLSHRCKQCGEPCPGVFDSSEMMTT
ncbi:MAG: AmmeMemoRadiSam system radical SAM enzyme [Candidatus Dadabacteria bacterium]|nr:MAG: AmmeMemoRadiSam system radical SAM enzyme [Candidatus Dadabacteria bacterium]